MLIEWLSVTCVFVLCMHLDYLQQLDLPNNSSNRGRSSSNGKGQLVAMHIVEVLSISRLCGAASCVPVSLSSSSSFSSIRVLQFCCRTFFLSLLPFGTQRVARLCLHQQMVLCRI